MHVVCCWTVYSHNGYVHCMLTVRCGQVFGKWRHSVHFMSRGHHLCRNWQYLVHSLLCWDIRLWFLHFVYKLRCWNLLGRCGCNGGRVLRELRCGNYECCGRSDVHLAVCGRPVRNDELLKLPRWLLLAQWRHELHELRCR